MFLFPQALGLQDSDDEAEAEEKAVEEVSEELFHCHCSKHFSLLTCCFVCLLLQIDKQLDAVFSKGKPHIKKNAAPVAAAEQIKGEQQGENKRYVFGELLGQGSRDGAVVRPIWPGFDSGRE